MKWAKHVARMVEVVVAYTILVGGKTLGAFGELKDQY